MENWSDWVRTYIFWWALSLVAGFIVAVLLDMFGVFDAYFVRRDRKALERRLRLWQEKGLTALPPDETERRK